MSTFRKQTQTSYLLKRCLQEPCSNLHHRPERRRQHLHDQLRRELRFRRHHLAGQHLSAPVPVPLHYCGVLQERPQHCRGEFKGTLWVSHHCYRLKTWTRNSWLGSQTGGAFYDSARNNLYFFSIAHMGMLNPHLAIHLSCY